MKKIFFNSGDPPRRITTASSLITILLVFLGECWSHYFLYKNKRSSPSTGGRTGSIADPSMGSESTPDSLADLEPKS